MDQILPAELDDLEFEDIGYAKEVLGGLVLTDDGLDRIAIDRQRVQTFVEADASR